MSGAAAQYKGDVEIPFYNYPGKYIIECKLSAQRKSNGTDEPMIRIAFPWFPKLHEEARNMDAKFGILIIHYLGYNDDYVFIRRHIIDLLTTRYRSPYADILTNLASLAPVLDFRFNKDKPKSGHNLQRKDIEKAMIDISGMRGVKFITPDGEYLIIHLSAFKLITEHL
jgi:hypothetical protein